MNENYTPDAEAGMSALSAWLDAEMGERIGGLTVEETRLELLRLHRTIKTVEEIGESISVVIGAFGANPRKGVVASSGDVVDELLDVAISALGAVEHWTGNGGDSMRLLEEKLARVLDRAGIDVPDVSSPCHAEVWSWDYFSTRDADPYWIRCDLLGQHAEHYDSHTGARWTA